MKPYLAVALLCILTVHLFSQPNSRAPKKDTDTENHAGNTVTVINNAEGQTDTHQTKASPPRWYTSSEWWLVIVAALTGAIIAIQARESRKATGASQRSIALQEIAMQQWVDVEDVKGDVRELVDARMEHPETLTLDISFKVVNPTSYPLTLLAVSTSIDGKRMDDSPGRAFLPPKNSHPFDISLSLGKEQVGLLFEGKLALSLTGIVFYKDAFKKQRVQPFGRLCVFSPSGGIFEAYRGRLPQPIEQDDNATKQSRWKRLRKRLARLLDPDSIPQPWPVEIEIRTPPG